MTPDDMARDCLVAIAAGTRITLVRGRGAPRLLGFPRGELLCENFDGRNVYSYDPARVLAWLVQAGVPIYTVAELLGHSNVAVTKRYAHLAPRQLVDAIAAIA